MPGRLDDTLNNPITRYLKAVRSCTEADWQVFVNHRRVKALMMISSTLREGVSAGLGRDDVRTVTVALREPCARALLLPIFPLGSVRLETGGKHITLRACVIDGNEPAICYPGTLPIGCGNADQHQ